jgi:MFS family permease
VKKRSLAISILLTAGGFGGLVMVPMMTSMVNEIGWRNAYLILAAIVFLILFILPALLIVNKPENLGQVPDGVLSEDKKGSLPDRKNLYGPPVDFTAAEAVKTSAFWYLTIASTAFMVGMQGFMLHQLIFLEDINIPKTTASIAYGVFVGVSAVGRLGMGFLGIRYPSRHLIIMAYVMLVCGFAIMLFAKTLPMILLYNIVIGLGMGGIYVAKMNLIPAFFGKTYYPKIAGFTLPFATVIGSIGSPLTGRIRDVTGSYEMAWQLAILVIAIGLIAMVLARPPVHPSLRKAASTEVLH